MWDVLYAAALITIFVSLIWHYETKLIERELLIDDLTRQLLPKTAAPDPDRVFNQAEIDQCNE